MINLFIVFSPFVIFTIIGNSMRPTLEEGKKILVQKKWFFCRLKVGDIIALKDPRDARLLVKRLQEIHNGKYYVIGDNREESTDSRKFGFVTKKNIIGKVIGST